MTLRAVLRGSIVALVFFLGGCGGSDRTGGPPPCETAAAPALCGERCSVDDDCGTTLYCSTAGECTADCGTAAGQCGTGRECSAHGRCVDTDLPDDCPMVVVSTTPVVPIVELLIDQSGSMTDSFGSIGGMSVDRWEAAQYALTDPTVGAVTQLQDRVRFGAALYHSEGGSAGGECPMLARSTGAPAGFPVLGNAGAIRQLFDDNGPNQDTPTAESVDMIHGDILSWPVVDADQTAPIVLVLATDGNPDNCGDADAHNAASQNMSESAVERAWQDGIKTVALSVGSDVSDAHMQRLANAGAGMPRDASPGAPWYRGNDPQELVDAFNEIIRGVRVCTFGLNATADPNAAPDANVTLNGQPLTYGTDWTLTDGSTLELLGAACQTYLDTDDVFLEAIFPCGGAVID